MKDITDYNNSISAVTTKLNCWDNEGYNRLQRSACVSAVTTKLNQTN